MFQVQYLVENDPNAEKLLKHHKSNNSSQKTFRTQVLKLADAMKALGDPFQGDVEELVNIGTGNCASEEVFEALSAMKSLGQNQFKNFVKTVIPSRRIRYRCLKYKIPNLSGDLDKLFMHENQPYPPSLSEFGKLRFGKKSDLLMCVKPAHTEQSNPPSFYDCKTFDEAGVVHALPSTTVSTFDSYAENVFILMIHSESSPIE